jgi:Flp pilus assembly protein TadD
LVFVGPAKRGDFREALELARKAVELDPKRPSSWNTLGLANYLAGNWDDECAALEKSTVLLRGGDGFDRFLMAMVHWQRGERDQARRWFETACKWMAQKQARNEELRRFRAEADAIWFGGYR